MSWHYQACKIIPKEGESYYAMREVHKSYKKTGWTANDIAPIGDTRLELIDVLTTMLKDACYHKVRIITEEDR